MPKIRDIYNVSGYKMKKKRKEIQIFSSTKITFPYNIYMNNQIGYL